MTNTFLYTGFEHLRDRWFWKAGVNVSEFVRVTSYAVYLSTLFCQIMGGICLVLWEQQVNDIVFCLSKNWKAKFDQAFKQYFWKNPMF